MARVKRISAQMNLPIGSYVVPLLPEPKPEFGYMVHAVHSEWRSASSDDGTDIKAWWSFFDGWPVDAEINHAAVSDFYNLTVGSAAAGLVDVEGGNHWWTGGGPASGNSTTVSKSVRPTHFPFPVPIGPLVRRQAFIFYIATALQQFRTEVIYETVRLTRTEWTTYRNTPVVDEVNYHNVA